MDVLIKYLPPFGSKSTLDDSKNWPCLILPYNIECNTANIKSLLQADPLIPKGEFKMYVKVDAIESYWILSDFVTNIQRQPIIYIRVLDNGFDVIGPFGKETLYK